MTRTLALTTALLATLFTTAGVAVAKTTANTKWLNTKWLNTSELGSMNATAKWLKSADLNASNGGPSFYNPWTGQTLPDVYLDRTTFFSSNGASGDAFSGTWMNAILGEGDPATSPGEPGYQSDIASYAYISGRFQPAGADPDTFLYWVHIWSPDRNGAWAWHHACLDKYDAPVPAIPLAGEWSYKTGARISYGGNRFTWACTSGALGKCAASGLPNTLGYAPWKTRSYYLLQHEYGVVSWIDVDGQRIHQACTRMIRADYCGDGTSATVTGNEIDARDFLWSGHREAHTIWYPEALWDETGARWVSNDRSGVPQTQDLICTNNHYVIGSTADTNVCFAEGCLPTPEQVFPHQTGIYQLPAFVGPGKLLLANRTKSWPLVLPPPTMPWLP